MAKKNQSSKKELASKYFEENAEKKIVHITSDDFTFDQLKHALDHANTLEESQREVETFKNGDSEGQADKDKSPDE